MLPNVARHWLKGQGTFKNMRHANWYCNLLTDIAADLNYKM